MENIHRSCPEEPSLMRRLLAFIDQQDDVGIQLDFESMLLNQQNLSSILSVTSSEQTRDPFCVAAHQ